MFLKKLGVSTKKERTIFRSKRRKLIKANKYKHGGATNKELTTGLPTLRAGSKDEHIIHRNITWTLSEESDCASSHVVDKNHGMIENKQEDYGEVLKTIQKVEEELKTEQEDLGRKGKKKDKKVKKQEANVVIFTEQELMQHELNHMREIAKKKRSLLEEQTNTEEIKKGLQARIKGLQLQLDETTLALATKSSHVQTLEEDLSSRTLALAEVSATLIQTQHSLHELQSRHWSWNF